MPRQPNAAGPPVTFLASIFNEEARVRIMLENAVQWADEVLVLDKGSTDRTKEIYAGFGDRIKVVDIPFTPKGHGDFLAACRLPANDWIYVGTASEIPTRKLVSSVRSLLAEKGGDLEIVYVPRKIYSFGMFSPHSPWNVSYYPFLFNRRKAILANVIHENIRPADSRNTAKVEFSDDCCVYHFTHPTAKEYLADMAQYFEAEAESATPYADKISQCFRNLKGEADLRGIGEDWLGVFCAWNLYWLGAALFLWEKHRGRDVKKYYDEMKRALFLRDWGPEAKAGEAGPPSPPAGLSEAPPADRPLLWEPGRPVRGEDDLLLLLAGRPVCGEIRVLYVIGAHMFQEREMFFRLFPRLEKVYLFEPIPDLFARLAENARGDGRIEVFPYAISDRDGAAEFHVTNNQASSSLLRLGRHRDLFPHVAEARSIPVECRTLGSLVEEKGLRRPDMLFVDVQGAEYMVLSAVPEGILSNVRLVYTEASTEDVYQGARPLTDLRSLLEPDFRFLGFAPLTNEIVTHGNALFVNRRDEALLDMPGPGAAVEGGGAPRTGAAGNDPLVSAIVSTYNAERFLRGRLEDLLAQTLGDRLEVIVVDSGSAQGERAIVEEFRGRHPNVRYIRTEARETVYKAWNRGIEAARGKYLTNANTDDRLRPDALEILCRFLEEHPDVGVVYADQLVTETENDAFAKTRASLRWRWPDFLYEELERRCIVGPQPMWRKALHERHGMFREEMVSAGDYEFWLRIGRTEKFVHLPEILGLYFQNRGGLEHGSGVSTRETDQLREEYGIRRRGVRPVGTMPEPLPVEERDRLPYRTPPGEYPLVSVVIPTYNRPDLLVRAVRSALAQTYGNIEVVVVNDGGADVGDLLRPLGAPRRLLYLDPGGKRGVAGARNAGLRAASGRYIAYLDDDDIFYPDHIETLVGALQEGGVSVAYTDAIRVHQERRGEGYAEVKRDVPYSRDFNRGLLLVTNYIPTPCIMHEKACTDRVGGFDESLATHEDWELWIRIAKEYPFRHVPRLTCEITWRKDGSSTTSSRLGDFCDTLKTIYARHVEPGPLGELLERLRKVNLLEYEAKVRKDTASRTLAARERDGGTGPVDVSIILPVCGNGDLPAGSLEDLAGQTIGDRLEVVVVDARPPADRREAVADLRKHHGNAVCAGASGGSGKFAAWNAAVRIAKGRHILPLEPGDRLRRDACELLSRKLDERPDVVLVYGDTDITATPGQSFGRHDRTGELRWPEYSHADLVSGCRVGPHPMWRKNVHEEIGFFDERYAALGDQEFWLRMAERFNLLHVDEVTGLQLDHPGRISNRREVSEPEERKIRAIYGERFRKSDPATLLSKGCPPAPPHGEARSPATGDGIAPAAASRTGAASGNGETAAERGRRLKREKKAGEALAAFEDARASGDLTVLTEIGDVLAADGKFEEAEARYREAMTHRIAEGKALVGLGVLGMVRGDAPGAGRFFESAIAIDGGDADALCGLALVRKSEGKTEEALRLLVRSLSAEPRNLTALHELVKSAHELSRWDEAEAALRAYLAYTPSDANILFSLAGVLFKASRLREAQDVLDRVGFFAPDFAGAAELRRMIGESRDRRPRE